MNWLEFALAWAVFFITHSLPLRPSVRTWFQARLGRRGFTVAYSLLSLGALIWLIRAAGRAPFIPLWDWAPWQGHLTLALMLLAFLIMAFAIGRPNPFSFGGARNDAFKPERAGIIRFTRHPLLMALSLWATAHVIPNGDLAHVLLFGVFAGFALSGQHLVDRRRQREMGADWQRLWAKVTNRAINALPLSWSAAFLRLAIGGALYAGVIWVHPWLFGVNPLG